MRSVILNLPILKCRAADSRPCVTTHGFNNWCDVSDYPSEAIFVRAIAKTKKHAQTDVLLVEGNSRLLGRKSELVQINRVRRLVDVAVDLVIDGDPVPVRGRRRVIAVQGSGLTVQS